MTRDEGNGGKGRGEDSTTHVWSGPKDGDPSLATSEKASRRARGARLLLCVTGGAAMLGLLFLADFVELRLDFMGYSDDRAVSRILHEYGADIMKGQLRLLVVMALFGAGFGLLGGVLLALRGRLEEPSRRGLVSLGAGTALAAHALFFARHLVRYPQLYSESLYDGGGVKRAVMVALTRHTRPGLYIVLGALLLAALVPTRRGLVYAGRRLRTMPLPTLGIIVVSSIVGAYVALHARRGPHATRPNVLLVAIDSLRADRVFENHGRFPTLEALARKSVRFKESHVTVARTFPSFVTLLTGRYPYSHGIREMFPSEAERDRIGTSLPRALVSGGYQTAVVSDYAGEIFSRTPIGFQTVDVPRFDMHTIVDERGLQLHLNALPYAAGAGERFFPFVRAMSERADPQLLVDRTLHTLDRLDKDTPFFLTVFFSTAHFPYSSPWPYYQRFTDPAYDGAFLYDKPPLSPAQIGPADVKQIQALYDGSVASVDDALARLFHELERRDLADDTIVVLLADHGENLWDDPRAGMGHGDHFVGDHGDHVPLLVYDPRHPRPHDVDSVVRDIDVAPTLATLCGIAPPPVDGTDLGPLLRGEKADLELPAFSETEYWFIPSGPGFSTTERLPYPAVTGATDLAADGDVYMRPEVEPLVIAAKHRALRLGDYKLVYRPTRAGVLWSLFDVKHDPDDRRDLVQAEPERFLVMRDFLYAWMLDDRAMVRRGEFVVPR
ncbi:MAG: sulfatase [Polyangia bacterium]